MRCALVLAALAVVPVAPAQSLRSPLAAPLRTVLAAPSVTVPLTKAGSFYFTDVLVNGKRFRFTLETGAAFLGVSPRLIRELGLKVDSIEVMPGTKSPVVAVDSVTIGGATLHGLTGRVMPLFENMDFDGIVSVSMLRDLMWTMDLAGSRLVLERGELPAENGRDIVPFAGVDRAGRVDVHLDVDGTRVPVTFDTRYADWITISDSLAPRLRLDGALRTVGTAWGPAQGTFEMRGARMLGDVRVGGHTMTRPAMVFRNRSGGIVGVSFLEQFQITVDPKNRRMRLTQSGTAPLTMPSLPWEAAAFAAPPDASAEGPQRRVQGAPLQPGERTFGFRMAARSTGGLTIVQLVAGSAAEKAGLRENDEVVEFDGTPAAQMNPGAFRAALARDTPVKVVVRRGGEHVTASVQAYRLPAGPPEAETDVPT